MAIKHLITCVVAGIDYLIHPQILGSVQETVRADQILPVLVLSERELESGPEKLWDILQYYVNSDDVCIDDFTGILVLAPPSGSDSDRVPGDMPVSDLGQFSSIYHLVNETMSLEQGHDLPSGPYFLSGPNLHQAWRLYPDDLEAFNFGLIPDSVFAPRSFQAIASLSSESMSKTIPVPSRHYHHPTPEMPLAGVRLALSDPFDIEGVKTTLSSRAWAELYPIVTSNGFYVNQLLDRGAIIVGKTKTTQFSSGMEWVDFHSPANPRADMYQISSGNSAGAAAALAGYPWLDNSVGLDAERTPVVQHGLYALRSTIGSTWMDRVKTLSPRYDTVGIYGRSLIDLTFLTAHSLRATPHDEATSLPKKIIYPINYVPLADPAHQRLFEGFVKRLEAYLGVKRVEVDLEKLWLTNSNVPLKEYLEKASIWPLCEGIFQGLKQFWLDYHDKYECAPFLEEGPRLRWNIGANVTTDDRDLYLSRLEAFKAWFDREVFSLGEDSHQEAIMVLPFGDAGPAYRDMPVDEPLAPSDHDATMLSAILGTPHVIVPFAQLPYESRISGRTEYKPISGSIIGGRGSDLTLIRIVEEALESAGWRTRVDTGRFAFPVGSNARNVNDGDEDAGTTPPCTSLLKWSADEL